MGATSATVPCAACLGWRRAVRADDFRDSVGATSKPWRNGPSVNRKTHAELSKHALRNDNAKVKATGACCS